MKTSKLLFAITFSGLLLLVGYWWWGRYNSVADELQNHISRIQLEDANRAMKLALHQLGNILKEGTLPINNRLANGDTVAQVVRLDVFPESKSIQIQEEGGLPSAFNMRKPRPVWIDTTQEFNPKFKMDVKLDSTDGGEVDTLINFRLDVKAIQDAQYAESSIKAFADSVGIKITVFNTLKDTIVPLDTLGKWYWTDFDLKVNADAPRAKVFTTKSSIMVIEDYQFYLVRKIIAELLAGVFLFGGFLLYYWLVARDEKRQQARLEEKDRFIANVAHELKTPIATVGVALEALQNFGADADPARRKNYTKIARKELGRLELLANRALGSIQLEAGQVETKQEMVDLVPIIDDAWRGLAMRHGLELERLCYFVSHNNGVTNEVAREGLSSLQLPIKGNGELLEHLFYNLLDNACKYAGETVEIKLKIEVSKTTYQIKVCDNGPGVPEADRERIFAKFYRVDDGQGHRVKGHGLGLSYARQIVQAHGGSLQLIDTQSPGACFELILEK